MWKVRQCTPRVNDPTIQPMPFIDFSSSYVLRSIALFPKQGSDDPWRIHQNYLRDIQAFLRADISRDMEFVSPAPMADQPVGLAA